MDNKGIKAEDLVWIFGTGRSGSTWLASMMGELAGGLLWNEPLVGRLFGDFYDDILPRTRGRDTFIMAEANREAWLEGIRHLVLNVAESVCQGVATGGYLVVKEPNGSIGAPLLMEALPESRMILLVRDPRDVAASALDGHRKGSHAHERASTDPRKAGALAKNSPDSRPGAFLKRQANRYLRSVGNAKRAYDDHRGYKALVRYEDLRTETLETMKRLYRELDITVEEDDLARAVDKHAWENIPEEEKGPGKFNRKATPGGWREDLTPRQVETVEEITAPLLEEFYPA
jgi:Sulfotransferase domain